MRYSGYSPTPVGAIVVEASWPDVEQGEWQSKVTPAAAVGSLLGWIAAGVPIIMAGNHEARWPVRFSAAVHGGPAAVAEYGADPPDIATHTVTLTPSCSMPLRRGGKLPEAQRRMRNERCTAKKRFGNCRAIGDGELTKEEALDKLAVALDLFSPNELDDEQDDDDDASDLEQSDASALSEEAVCLAVPFARHWRPAIMRQRRIKESVEHPAVALSLFLWRQSPTLPGCSGRPFATC